ncbi:methylenetetrahydrofolate reductase [Gluconobacter kanchanaburiensis]|uniref:Methylenetetrahydrofolate reductase n=1 Tax=Gluconobacter kanchanaburiensis NBRC 103587 TaxID=1307948 RepID=A0A511BA26_9PROT|nr:methylenetetrahydrofolate reductase [Gluconobacter kanchanaburiensis]MBF0862141.1 methylenetetrahydrofolate reductase [Gluconobacter kanchanaburiensis]GBR71268.1 5,10-methylenetetrahydrofolate reductase [Gluconobacter kanchanaburiensis NBRC 103587]GEK96591.1 methylenetetrahydrofolate reductase [Gluconobacter kanchanaburiensis NBRC 103587]
MRVSVELVPRSPQALLADVQTVREVLPQVSTLNIPDLMRFDLRSCDAASLLVKQTPFDVIPHVRAVDIAPGAPLPGADRPELTSILVVAGDPPPAGSSLTVYPNTSAQIIERYRREAPHLKVYAVFDPYRRAPYHELEEVARKRDAGACGFFTQPLFDVPMLECCMDWLRDDTVFWGISPVLGEKSRRYWERINHVVFPGDYDGTLEGNIALARRLLTTIRMKNDNAYLMPLKVDLASYLGALADIITG